jgi:hypothetical protein
MAPSPHVLRVVPGPGTTGNHLTGSGKRFRVVPPCSRVVPGGFGCNHAAHYVPGGGPFRGPSDGWGNR